MTFAIAARLVGGAVGVRCRTLFAGDPHALDTEIIADMNEVGPESAPEAAEAVVEAQ
jgi:hypothetical protein